jgi:hypothetical protein
MSTTTPRTRANKARLDNRWGSLVSSVLFSNFNIPRAIDAQCRPSGASA